MTEEARLLRRRSLVGWLATALCLTAVLSLADSFVDSFRTGPVTFSMLVGGQESLSGPLPRGATDAGSIAVAIDHPGLRLEITTEGQGFWFGNRMWQGTLYSAPDTSPGTANITLRGPEDPTDQPPPQAFVMHIFPNQQALNAASHSRLRRLSGLSPMGVAGGCLLFAFIPGTLVFFLSRRIEALRTQEGRAEIYKTKKTPEGLVCTFGLGSRQGLALGDRVTVRVRDGQTVTAQVVRVVSTEADALIDGPGQATCGDFVRITKEKSTIVPGQDAKEIS
jgi:hypothetical protein